MFGPITIPFDAKVLVNTVKLKPGVSVEDVEIALGEMCNVVKGNYGGGKGGFIAGQVLRFSGFISDEGSLSNSPNTDHDIAIVTYWRSFEEHERSHADELFHAKFSALAERCADSKEIGYEMLWQGNAE
ncbi:MAG: hypothetical protein ABL891_02670 [Burkholderiales bacterium]